MILLSIYVDPCADKKCGPGRECMPGDKGKAKCVCMKACPEEEDNRRRVKIIGF